MYFGIRGKVALLVMLATAASALLVAKVLTYRATAVLREHELVDLGDEASLRGWELVDRIEGLRDDLINLAFSPTFLDDFRADASQEQLLSMARGLCRRNWKDHLRVDLVTFQPDGTRAVRMITEKARIGEDHAWFPKSNARAGSRLHLSPIQRLQVTRTDLPGREELTRWEPVIWAVAPLDSRGGETGGATYVRIMMTLHLDPSPRHLFAMENERGAQLVRHDEDDPLDRGNDAVFLALTTDGALQEALAERRAKLEDPAEAAEQPKVDRLARKEYVRLKSPYYFQEGLPPEALTLALRKLSDEEIDDYLTSLQIEFASLGRVGGLLGGVRELRFLARSPEDLEELREVVSGALREKFPEAWAPIDWRDVVECDEIHSWAVKMAVGHGENREEYLFHYAVLDDELASSIEHEMKALQSIALLVAGAFGIIGFLIAMAMILPLKQMTKTAQKITESNPESLYKQVAELASRLDSRRRDEVGDIARASKRLFEELAAFQEDLEHRVEERTRDLSRAKSKLEKANEKLKTLSEEKDAFVAKVSHDLRQPLNAIFLQVEALKLSDLDEGQKRDVERIHAHAARELNLVNDILEYQKIIMGAETLAKDEIDIPHLVQDLAESYRPGLAGKGVEFQATCEDGLAPLVADDRRVRQVLGNLLGNATKFTREGSVSLEARSREVGNAPWVEFTVTDTGRGMSPEEQSKVFVPFVSNKKDNAGGSGLGLSICRELVAQMGGKIGFVSELDKGTHFSVFLPLEPTSEYYEPRDEAPGEETDDPDSAARPLSPGGSEHNILVIDDDAKVRDLLRRLLEEEGYRVTTARDGAEGLEIARENPPDAITLDVVMPGKDGWQVLHELKDSPDTQSIPVIMVSVMAEHEDGVALDVEDYLVKPIDVDRLKRVIQRTTGQSPQQNLLLVDDDESSLEAMSRILEEAGWKTLRAHDGAEALEILSKTRPAAIMLDLIMPGMDGFEFLHHVQEDSYLRSIPVIVVTGKDPTESELEFLRTRVDTVVRKGRNAASDLIASVNARVRRAG